LTDDEALKGAGFEPYGAHGSWRRGGPPSHLRGFAVELARKQLAEEAELGAAGFTTGDRLGWFWKTEDGPRLGREQALAEARKRSTR
jgi:hypothetical protein